MMVYVFVRVLSFFFLKALLGKVPFSVLKGKRSEAKTQYFIIVLDLNTVALQLY